MRILIVNGFNKSPNGLKKFSEFQFLIMKVRKKILKATFKKKTLLI